MWQTGFIDASVSIDVPYLKSTSKRIHVNVFSVLELIMLKCSEWLKDRIIFYKPYTQNNTMLLFACTVGSTGGFMQSWSCIQLSQFQGLLRLTTVKWGNVWAKVQCIFSHVLGKSCACWCYIYRHHVHCWNDTSLLHVFSRHLRALGWILFLNLILSQTVRKQPLSGVEL